MTVNAMGREIERKFLVRGDLWRSSVGQGAKYRQGYLSTDPARVVRVRIVGPDGWLTVKGVTAGIQRPEFDYPIPGEDAAWMLDHLCLRPLIEKTRYRVPFEGRTWEVDEFSGDNAGLVIAEVELPSVDAGLTLPPWVGTEVSGDARYFNSNLVRNPFTRWPQ